jgi:riboflavin kinase/FMN adenylyltransferase
MEVVKGDAIKSEEGSVVVALGTFDGIHYGHQQIIKKTINSAQRLECDSALFSFSPHPLRVVAPQKAPYLITSWEQKNEILKELGIDKVYLKYFTIQFSRLSFKDFVKDYLVDGVNAQKVIVGQDFRFGHKGLGSADKLKEMGSKLGFEVEVLEAIAIEDQIVSSTYIRELIEKGKVGEVKNYLTRNYSLIGQVINGDKRGRKLGFPTANLRPKVQYVIPKSGVYAVYVYTDGEKLKGIAHLGARPTFDQSEFAIEVHIFDFKGNIYDQDLEIEFIKRIRGEMSFDSKKSLINQIEMDITKARQLLIDE